MKKCIAVLLCICSLLTLSVTAFASDIFQYTTDDWKNLYSVPEPQREDYEDSADYGAAWDAWNVGFSNYIIEQTQAEYARQAEEAAQEAAEEESQKEEAAPNPAESTPTKTIESAGTKNASGVSSYMVDDIPDKYPVGSYVDVDGAVWSPDGARLSPLAAPGTALASGPSENGSVLSSELADTDSVSGNADVDTLELIAGFVADIATDPPMLYLEDLRPVAPPVTVLDGMKALVTSIFGEYTPVTTTSVVTQTVGNDVHQYLIESVAPGAAGVDYEWIASVALFGVMLFCLMKLLGGILK